ncbi:DUF1127 domain-containing protein [Agarivorans litoreus]|uniref:DUF1127 domain-containing protein n=1 Tax=Agarivorans litoreus TaxID=1510455 RepID=UPI001C7CA621|nr:DUF1127 domain-containing protein [Agarivorans litoreus]
MQIQTSFHTGFHALIKRLALYRARRRSRRALLALNDELLKDIGLSRAQALAEGRKPFWRAAEQAKYQVTRSSNNTVVTPTREN